MDEEKELQLKKELLQEISQVVRELVTEAIDQKDHERLTAAAITLIIFSPAPFRDLPEKTHELLEWVTAYLWPTDPDHPCDDNDPACSLLNSLEHKILSGNREGTDDDEPTIQ